MTEEQNDNRDNEFNNWICTTTVIANRSNPSEILRLILDNFDIENEVLLDLRPLSAESSFKLVCNYIQNSLPFNKLQYLVVKEIFDYIMRSKDQIQITAEDQLLLYIRGKGNVGKSWVI